MTHLKRIGIWNLRLGMTIVKCDKMGVPFFEYGEPLSNLDFVQSLSDFGVQNVYIISTGGVTNTPSVEYTIEKQTSNQYLEFAAATELVLRTKSVLNTLFEDLKKGNLNVSSLNDCISEVVESAIDISGLFTGIAEFLSRDESEVSHSLSVALNALTIGQLANLSKPLLIELLLAGLLHDIGKYRVPPQIHNKKTQLTDAELAVFKRHPEYGHDILKRTQGVSSDVAVAILQHHEYFDGTGYPSNVRGQYTSTLAKIISVAETYQTMLCPNCEGLPVLAPDDAVKKIFASSGKQFSSDIVKFFILAIGIYPIGTVVKLSNGDIGMVIELNIKEPIKPKVLSFGAKGVNDRKLIDLSKQDIKILGHVDKSEVTFKPQEIALDFLNYMLRLRIL